MLVVNRFKLMLRTLLLMTILCTCGCAQGQNTISPTDQDYQISIFFGGGSYYIDQEQATRLRDFLDGIPDIKGYEVEVQGHTDDIGNRDYNLRLSDYRTRSVKERLIAYPVPEGAIHLLPLGEDSPSFDNATWKGKLSNRRVDVIFRRVVL